MLQLGPRVLVVAILVVTAGCSGTLVDEESAPASIPDAALETHDYVHQNTTELPLTYRLGGVVPVVSARTWASAFTRTTAGNDTAVLLVYSSPTRRVAGRSVNPLKQLSNRELVGFVLERVSGLQALGEFSAVRELREDGRRNLTMLGQPTQMTTYAGTAELDGQPVGVVVNIAAVEHRGDVVLALGFYADVLDDRRRQAALIERIEH